MQESKSLQVKVHLNNNYLEKTCIVAIKFLTSLTLLII